MLQGQDLATVTQRALRQQAQLGQAVDHHARRIETFHPIEDQTAGLAEFHLGGMQDRQFLAGIETGLRRHEFEDRHAVEAPAMPFGHQLKLALGLRQADIKRGLPAAHPFEKELHRQRGLARAGTPLIEIHPLRVEPAAQNEVQSLTTGRSPRGVGRNGRREFLIVHLASFFSPYPRPLEGTRCKLSFWR